MGIAARLAAAIDDPETPPYALAAMSRELRALITTLPGGYYSWRTPRYSRGGKEGRQLDSAAARCARGWNLGGSAFCTETTSALVMVVPVTSHGSVDHVICSADLQTAEAMYFSARFVHSFRLG
jgi:hypothetical protein